MLRRNQFERNQVIVSVLVFMIAIAGYLSLTSDEQTLIVPDFTAEVGEVVVVDGPLNNETGFFDDIGEITTLPPDAFDEDGRLLLVEEVAIIDAAMSEKENAIPASMMETDEVKEVTISKKDDEAVETTAGAEVSYFAEERMLRDQTRAAQIESLEGYAADANMDKDQRAKAAENLLLIQDRIEKENGAESLLRAKGFTDAFVRMDDNTVDVIINKESLSDEEIAQIEEIVQRKTGCTIGQIKISRLSVNEQTAQK